MPALLSTFAVGTAAAARGVVGQLLPWLFLGSLGFLSYAYYLVWLRHRRHQTAQWILVVNTLLAGYLWYERVQIWIQRWLS